MEPLRYRFKNDGRDPWRTHTIVSEAAELIEASEARRHTQFGIHLADHYQT